MSALRRLAACAAAAAVLGLVTPSPAQAEGLAPWWYDRMALAEIHEQTRGEGVRIAIIDSAINLEAPELDGATIELGSGYSEDEPGGSSSYPDALWAGHGTAMTSLVVGQGTGNTAGGRGIVGVAPEAEVTFHQIDPDPYTEELRSFDGLLSQVLAGEPDIISISVAGTSLLPSQLDQLAESGAVVVAGAGEEGGTVRSPAAHRGIVSVGAVDQEAQPWDDQPSGGGEITFCAPGVDVASGAMEGPARGARWVSGVERTGTSSATAILAGSFALVKARWPEATANQLIQSMIHANGQGEWGFDQACGFGIVRIGEQLEADPAGWPDENPTDMSNAAAYEAYPPSVYEEPSADEPATRGDDTEDAAATTDGTGTPWTVIGISSILVLAGILGAILWARRRTSGTNHSRGA